MSRLTPGLIPLDKGLNLQTAKIAAPEGSVLDTLNYEQVDFQGQKRIDGFGRYDGKLAGFLDDYYVTEAPEGSDVGDVYVDDSDNVIGIILDFRDIGDIALGVIDYNNLPAGTWGHDTDNIDEHYENLVNYNNVLRNFIGQLPGPIASLHWFRDRLYAVAGLVEITVEEGGA